MPGYRYKEKKKAPPNLPDTHPNPPEGRELSMLSPIISPLGRIRFIRLIRLIWPDMPDRPHWPDKTLIIRGLPICRLLACKRPSIAMQKATFRIVKGGLLQNH